MSTTRVVGLSTNNKAKVTEIKWALAFYGIEVFQIEKPLNEVIKSNFFSIEKIDNKKYKPIYIIEEESLLINPKDNSSRWGFDIILNQMEKVTHISNLIVYSPNNTIKTYSFSVDGYIDYNRKAPEGTAIFGWDDIFVVKTINKTYWELNNLNHKYSARDKCLSHFIQDMIYYKSNIDLKHYPQNYDKCIDFSKDPSNFITNIEEYFNPLAKELNLSNIPINALNNGMFFRSAINRRQKLYWCPGLNAGIPFVPKPKDKSHELTYMFHDLSHFAMPDLIFEGEHNPLIQKVYIGYRLMSEAITLVLGDMLFVYSLLNTVYNYETVQARKIYPVFTRLYSKLFDGSISNEESIRILLQGSFEYCFYGDLTTWKKYMEDNEETSKILSEFTGKYDNYFLEDFRWTNMNYNYMKDNAKDYVEWSKEINSIFKSHNIQIYSVNEWIEHFNLKPEHTSRELNQKIFDSVYSTWIKPLLEKPIELSSQKSRLNSMFVRYMCGQSQIFFRFKSIYSESYSYWESIKNTLNYLSKNEINDEIIKNTREYYSDFLLKLVDNTIISDDDYNTYIDIYPIFKPFIIDYDNLQESKSLSEFSELMLTS